MTVAWECIPPIKTTRDELMGILQRQLVKAVAWDAANLAQHEKDTKAAVKAFRDNLREAMRWDWETIKASGFKAGLSRGEYSSVLKRTVVNEVPQCPDQMAPAFRWAIKALESDSRKVLTLSQTGGNSRMHWLATWDPDIKPEVC